MANPKEFQMESVGPLGEGLPPDLLNTPAMKQYLGIKKNHLDAILLYRMGDFYELFLQDAVEGSRILEIALTSRSHKNSEAKVPMAGVPAHSLGTYVNELTRKGYKVAICDQVEEASESKKIVERKVTRVVSPGLTFDSDTLEGSENAYLASIWIQNRKAEGRTEGALSVIDLTTGEFLYQEIEGKNWESEVEGFLSRFSPKEILLRGESKERVYLEAQGWGRRCLLSPVAEFYYQPSSAENYLKEQYRVHNLTGFGLLEGSPSVRVVGSLLRYLLETQFDHGLSHLNSPKRLSHDEMMILDETTLQALEIFPKGESLLSRDLLKSQERSLSLFEVVNQCETPMGKRALRKWLSAPLLNLAQIEVRQGAVRELRDQGSHLWDMKSKLHQMGDLERLFGKISLGTCVPRDLLRFQAALEKIEAFKKSWEGQKWQGRLDELQKSLDSLSDLRLRVESCLDPEPKLSIRHGNLLKEGFLPERDELAGLVYHTKEKIAQMESLERERTGISNLKIKYNKVYGYYIEVTKSHLSKVPEGYERRQSTVNSERFITEELKGFEQKVERAESELIRLEVCEWFKLLEELKGERDRVLKSCQILSELDCLMSLAAVALDSGWVFPEFTSDSTIELVGARHPVVECLLPTGSFVPNDLFLNHVDCQIALITGPNMAGKSTMMRQVALISLLAQVGSAVPCQSAKLGVVDRIFTRIGASDNISKGQSTFMVEMSEVAHILNHATSRSLILLDEVGRGTSTYDGLAIAWSLAEYLHEEIGAKTLFATHYHELTELEDRFPRVKNFNVAVEEEAGEIRFLHRLLRGGAPGSYGVHVARLAGVPEKCIQRAHVILGELESEGKNGISEHLPGNQLSLFKEVKEERENPLYREIVEEFQELDLLSLPPLESLLQIQTLQKRLKGQESFLQPE